MNVAATTLLLLACSADPTAGLKVPDGFAVTQFAGPELANDIYRLHIDSDGRVLVAGKGYVRHLIDTDGDGKADKAVDVIPPPTDGPMGLLWEGDTLYMVSDGGLKRYRKVDGTGPTKEKPDLLLKLKTGGEHDAHAVRRGADGKLWVLCGNTAGVMAKTITAKDSPVKDPVAGCVLRLNDDGTEVEVIADGFRNPYDFDFDYRGAMYTFDSDNERCAGLPWYEPTRVYRVLSGGNYGWLNPQHAQTWKLPAYFSAHPLTTAGRGSPTGVVYYRHFSFPREYRGQLFYADWTFGKIYSTHPYSALPTAKAFLEATGDTGFAPTGLAVHPKTGEMYVSVGGRGTRGAVYRIAPTTPAKGEPESVRNFGLNKVEPIQPGLNAEGFTTAKTYHQKLMALRSWELALGDLVDPKLVGTVWEGYSLRKPLSQDIAEVVKAARAAFPHKDTTLNREIARFLAAVQDDDADLLGKVTAYLPKPNDPVERVHYLIALGRLKGKRTADDTARIAHELTTLDEEYEARHILRDRHWPLRLTETAVALCEKDPKLLDAILAHPAFGHPEHVWLAKLPGMDAVRAARAFAARAAKEKNYRWGAAHAEIVAALPEAESRPLLLQLYDRGFTDAALLQLAKHPQQRDQRGFLVGLSSSSAVVVAACATVLVDMPLLKEPEELVPLIKALRVFPDVKTDATVRKAVLALLRKRSGESFDEVAKWEAWLTKEHPELATKLTPAGYDAAAWKKRLADVKWEGGDATRGKVVYAKARCAACHDGGTAVGPPLAGVAKRFSRDDLLTAILDPSRDIPARYRTTRFATTEGNVYEGVIIYEAPDGVILQTAADTTVRLAGKDIESKKPGTQSLMPVGLMDSLTAAEIADLFAHLKALGK